VANRDQSAPVTVLDEATRDAVTRLIARAELASGHPGLSEPSRLALAGPGGDFVGLVLQSEGVPAGYAHLSGNDTAWSIETVLDPDRPDATADRRRLLEAAVAAARGRGATAVRHWVNDHDEADDREADDHDAAELGFTPERDLFQMRVPLPLSVTREPLDETFSLRPFRPGLDEAAWLEVNNRAFAAHPEQGHWDLATLVAREQTSWFDPAGFVLCESAGALAGSCWTKVQADRLPALGEIYVISVDPAFQHRGLGRTLTVAGLDWLAERVSTGMLYVDAANEAAVALYRSLGFTVDHVDRCYILVP